jgi:glucokinase
MSSNEARPADVAIAIDVGGTGIKCGLVGPDGGVRHLERRPTGRERGPAAVVETIATTARALAATAHDRGLTAVACGVVIPGVVNEQAGVAEWSANLGLRDVALRALIAEELNLPTAVGHDVRAAALAEARLGAGRLAQRMLLVAIGTGIAGGYVVDGRIDPGAHGASGEIGHIVVRSGPDAAPCGCGAQGCLEAHASAAAIARAYRARGPGGGADGGADTAEIARRVAAGEPAATAVWYDAVDALVAGLLTGIALLDPEVIVLGGGLAEAGALLLDPVRAGLETRRTFHRLPTLTRAELGDTAGFLGAALLALDLAARNAGAGT